MKNSILLFDKNEIGIVNETNRNKYEFLDLNGNKLFTVTYEYLENDADIYKWLRIQNANESKITYVDFQALKISFDSKVIISDQLIKNYKLFNEKGPNNVKIEEFFSIERENLSEKYTQIVEEARLKKEADKKARAELRAELRPEIDNNDFLRFNNKIVGKISNIPTTQNILDNAQFLSSLDDLDGIKIISLIKKQFNIYEYVTIDGYRYEFKVNEDFEYTDAEVAYKMLMYALINGYRFEHQIVKELAIESSDLPVNSN